MKNAVSRLHALDHVRALGVLLVLLLHALVPYLTHKMRFLVWPVLEPNGNSFLDACFWWTECFVMPLFLLLSGFVTGRLLQQKSLPEFFEHRKRRLLFPLFAAICTLLPCDLYIWACGLVVHSGFPVHDLRSLKFDDYIDDNLWGLAHLWYLQYIFLYSLLVMAGAWIGTKWTALNTIYLRFESHIIGSKICLLLLAGIGLLYWEPDVVIAFQHDFWPVPSKFLYSGLFFLGGFSIQRSEGSIEWLKKWGPGFGLGAIVAYSLALPLIHGNIDLENSPTNDFLMCLFIVCTGWCSCFTLIGCLLRWLNRPVHWLGYLAGASFWIYLIHHPIVGLVHLILAFVSWPLMLKGILAWTVTLFLSAGSYELWVRQTKVGRWLNGSQKWRDFSSNTPLDGPSQEDSKPTSS